MAPVISSLIAEVRACQGCGACLLTCPEHAIRPSGGTLGVLGHFTGEARATGAVANYPDFTQWPNPRFTTPTSEQLPTKSSFIGLPAVDGALGIFKGLPLGLTNVGGIDLLLSASYVPTYGKSGD